MVLRDKSRAADPRKVAMAASDQPVKKKQRIDGPDIDESSVGSNGDVDIFTSEGLVDETRDSVVVSDEFLNTVRESPDSGTVSEDAVDCASVILETRCLDESFQRDKPLPHNSSQASNLNGTQPCESILTSDFEVLQSSLLRQCLCHLAEEVLRRPFHDHLKMSSWPSSKMLRFLSNLQLLFDVYLKQNNTGTICSRISHICDSLVRNEYNWIMEVMELADHKSKFVNYLAGRVLSSFFIVAKDSIDQNWLQQIVDNVYLFDSFNRITVQKINFSLDIIKRVVEWKNVDQHPLEETTMAITHVHNRQPSMADNPNPFGPVTSYSTAPHYNMGVSTSLTDSDSSLRNSDILQNAFSHLNTFNSSSNSCSSSSGSLEEQRPRERAVFKLHEPIFKFPSTSQSDTPEVMINKSADENNGRIESVNEQGCSTVILTDSESFDTSHIKYLTIKSLELHWPILMKNIKLLLTRYLNISNAENCILTFLSLWEIIISVKANLSVIDTKPFYADLHSFVDLLRCTTLPSLIYTQLLGLFNEVLCYGSTLALQDMLPEEICTLAHSIVRFVKDFRLLSDVQIRHSSTGFGFIGFESTVLREYSFDAEDNNHAVSLVDPSYGREEMTSEVPSLIEYETNPRPHNEVDKTMLQKMSLLVLKSVAVTVKEMRCDSSDSSIDSSDYNAIQDMQIVERSIRDVLKKLDVFIKNALEFHPETAFTKILIHLFSEQDDYLIESMVCTLDITVGVVYRNSMYPDLISMLNPILTFIEFLKVVSHDSDVLLDYLVSNETCFLLYLLRFLKYVRRNWSKFVETCQNYSGSETRGLDETMTVLVRLRLQISRLVSKSLFPYNISPVLRLLEVCESLYEGNELS